MGGDALGCVCVCAPPPPPLPPPPPPPLCFSLGRCSCAPAIPGAVAPQRAISSHVTRAVAARTDFGEARAVPVASTRAMKTPPRCPRGRGERRRRRDLSTARVLPPRNLPPHRDRHSGPREGQGSRRYTLTHALFLSLSLFRYFSLLLFHGIATSVNPSAALTLLTVGVRARHHYLRQIIC